MYPKNFPQLLRRIGICLCALALSSQTNADTADDFKLSLDKDGIQVELRDIEGSKYREFRAVTEIEASLPAAIALFQDLDMCDDWVFRCKESSLVETVSNTERYFHQVTGLPFPVKSRDLIFHATLAYQEDGSILVELNGVPDKLPEQRKYVRIQHAKVTYRFEPLDQGTLRITWQQHIDPAGSLPAWMVNSMQNDLPYESLVAFRELVKQAPYVDAEFVLDDSGTPIDIRTP